MQLGRPHDWTFVGPISRRFPELYVARGRAFGSKGEFARAISDCNEAIRLGREDAEVFQARGDAKAKLGDAAGAKKDFDRANWLRSRAGPQSKD